MFEDLREDSALTSTSSPIVEPMMVASQLLPCFITSDVSNIKNHIMKCYTYPDIGSQTVFTQNHFSYKIIYWYIQIKHIHKVTPSTKPTTTGTHPPTLFCTPIQVGTINESILVRLFVCFYFFVRSEINTFLKVRSQKLNSIR